MMRATIGLAALACLLAGQGESELARKDRERMQGKWKVLAAESRGEKVPAKDLEDLILLFEDDTIQVTEGGKTQKKYRFKLNPERKPREIDFTYTAGPKKGQTDRGIYQFQGDRLTFCIQENKDELRPREFATEADTGLFLVVLERLRP
jgi:uncharacterized protein (TIGR03067 family)